MGTFSLSKSGHVAPGGSSFLAEEMEIRLSSTKTRMSLELHAADGVVLRPPKGTSLGTHVAHRGPRTSMPSQYYPSPGKDTAMFRNSIRTQSQLCWDP